MTAYPAYRGVGGAAYHRLAVPWTRSALVVAITHEHVQALSVRLRTPVWVELTVTTIRIAVVRKLILANAHAQAGLFNAPPHGAFRDRERRRQNVVFHHCRRLLGAIASIRYAEQHVRYSSQASQ
jgi:hypothetical protein